MASPLKPSHVVIAYDATKVCGLLELRLTINNLLLRGDVLHSGDTIIVLGVLRRVIHPMGFYVKRCGDFFKTSIHAVEEEVTKKVDLYVNMLLQSAGMCEDQGISIEVKVTVGFPVKQVILQEVMASNASWVVLDRHLRRDVRFYLKQIPCKVALIQDSLSIERLRRHTTDDTDTIEHKLLFSLSKPVPLFNYQGNGNSNEEPTSARTNRDRLVQKERASRGGRIHLFIDHYLCWTERQQGVREIQGSTIATFQLAKDPCCPGTM